MDGRYRGLYAMVGFILLLFRNKPDKTIFWWSVGLILSPILLYFLKMHFLWLNAPAGILREAGFWIDKHLNGLEENGPGPAYQIPTPGSTYGN